MRGLALCLVLMCAAPVQADERLWAKLINTCVTAVETGRMADAAFLRGPERPWTCRVAGARAPCDGTLVTYRSLFGLSVDVVDPMERPEQGRGVACAIGRETEIPGNGEIGLRLRAAAHDALDTRLRFDAADQFGAWDVWRGCAWDGQEFRLSLMTQASFATFLIRLSSEDVACAPVVSQLEHKRPRIRSGARGGWNA